MASPNIYQSGAGGATGDSLVTVAPVTLLNAARFWYVSSTTGVNAASPAGRQREKPLATLAQAYTNASAGDVIVFLSNHAETIAVTATMSKTRLTLVSEGSGTARARFTSGVAGVMWDLTGAGFQLRNIYFPASTTTPVTARIRNSAVNLRVKDCYFECGALDTVPALQLATGAGQTRLDGSSWVVTASQPSIGVEVLNAVSDLAFEDCTFDGGSFGFSDYALKGTAAITGLRGEAVNHLNNADILLATGSSGYWFMGAASGSALLEQTA